MATPPTLIHIQGRATITTTAQRAVLNLAASDTGSDKDQVSSHVVSTVTDIQSELDELCPRLENGEISPNAPVDFYSIASLSISATDEYDDDGVRLEKKLYSASSNIAIHFRDFGRLGQMVVRLSSMPYVELRGIDWQLADEKKTELDEEARRKALRHAMSRARAYGAIIGRDKVTCIKIEDLEESWPARRVKQTARMASSSATFEVGAGIDFEPQLVDVSATLSVEFHAE
ncbi:uncharacterized protein Z520_08562 [Fonsecaea multimorphosa CBS 102226]|uniref:DUF541 domain-containing protein n=1 Tax=Fonsecaea multimorphosa CBS 102226 TaxID=1442371 RepID=A0A0D2JZ71_9EURO|nr:uncharacterized protein Z520_08562 [Fonsecaea multimorphosa CBS 102226]KIX95854.1 hypothetical protein Z520_08562 [Fonsecaea multimorphosa CBS 102226]OAL21589.1 hypothetical protein AYO22_07985 [Fonsecaea multimorphosa]